MPSLFRIGAYVVFFWSNENGESVHVHVCKGTPTPNATKIWFTNAGGCIIAHNNSRIPIHELNDLVEVLQTQFFKVCSEWKKHFDVELRFYC